MFAVIGLCLFAAVFVLVMFGIVKCLRQDNKTTYKLLQDAEHFQLQPTDILKDKFQLQNEVSNGAVNHVDQRGPEQTRLLDDESDDDE